MPLDLDTRRKRLLYRASHTGTRETNILFGGYIRAHGATMPPCDVDHAEALLGESDIDIVNWIMDKEPVPPVHDTPLMARLRHYAIARHAR